MADPISKGSCVGWWKANNAGSIHATTGALDTWDDISGAAHHMTATTTQRPTTGTRTINGKNVIDFNGTTNRMQCAIAVPIPWTICAFVASDAGADGTLRMILGSTATAGIGLGKRGTNKWFLGAGNETYSTVTVDTSPHSVIGQAKNPGTADSVRVDNVETSDGLDAGTSAMNASLQLGASQNTGWFWDGPMAEIVVYSVELNSTERAAMAAYFATEWVSSPKALDGKSATATNAKQGSVLHYR